MNTSHSLPSRFPAPRSTQSGATLIVGLVLLLVLTVVGVSGMNTATMEIAMAANTQFQQDAFQLAEDGIEVAIGTRESATDAPRVVDWLVDADADYDRRAVTTYRMNTPAPGSSVGELEAFHFDTTSVGHGPRNALAQHTQSFYVIGRAL
jgi:type IV pilus assembly protein PilX